MNTDKATTLRRERNLAQFEDSIRYREIACAILGKEELTSEELFIWYVQMSFAKMFEVAWREGQEPLNLYYTGLEIGREPTPVDGWKHYESYLFVIIQRPEKVSSE